MATAPGVLWTRPLKTGPLGDGGVVASADRLIVSAGSAVHFYSFAGEVVLSYRDPIGRLHSSPAADQQGNVYVNTPVGVTSIRGDTSVRWYYDRYIPPPANVEFAVLPPAILAPDGVVYATSYGGMLHAFEAETGNLVWTLPLGNGTLGLVAGAGHLLFANDTAGTLVVDIAGRKIVGRLNVDGQPAKVGSPLGGTGSALGVLGYSFGIVAATDGGHFALDGCAVSRWGFHNGVAQYASVIGTEERLLSVAWDVDTITGARQGGPNRVLAYSSSGSRVAGPVPNDVAPADSGPYGVEIPMYAGADGTTYSLYCDRRGDAPGAAKLLAYDRSLQKQWQLEIGPACPRGSGVLRDDGVLYLTQGESLLAIQTPSPGLASSSWPSPRHDNRGTAWLAP